MCIAQALLSHTWFRGHPVWWSAIDLFVGFDVFAELHIAGKGDAHSKYPPMSDLTSFLKANNLLFLLSLGCTNLSAGHLQPQSLRALCAPLPWRPPGDISHPVAAIFIFGKKAWEGVLCVLWSFRLRFWGTAVRFWQVTGLSHDLTFGAWLLSWRDTRHCPPLWQEGTGCSQHQDSFQCPWSWLKARVMKLKSSLAAYLGQPSNPCCCVGRLWPQRPVTPGRSGCPSTSPSAILSPQ